MKNRGQSLIIILLIAAVGLTIGLAVISRSVTDINISQQEEESARVFSVAEAGIEEAIRAGDVPSGGITIGEITATVEKQSLGGGQEFVFPGEYEAGDIQTLWLIGHDEQENLNENIRYNGSSLIFYWGKEGQSADQNTTPALEVTLIYKDGNTFKIKRGVYDPNSSRRASNHFDAPDTGTPPYVVDGKKFQFKKENFGLVTGTIPYLVRFRLIYNNEPQIIGVKGTTNLPQQGICFISTATSPNGITRRVKQCNLYKSPPGIFDYVLYSEENLAK
ncbi:MAG: hypothetical protein ACPLKP_00410 [Microgenomates group bacterium]